MKKALITGITGQDGSYLAELLLQKGYEVHGIIRRSSSFNTERLNQIYQDPHEQGRRLFLHYGDLSEASSIHHIITEAQPDEIYNLGAQSHVKVSFEIPEYTGNIDGLGTLRLLEAIRDIQPHVKLYQACSSEMFGKVFETPQRESTPFHPRSPYGCAKVFAYHLARNYREAYNLFISNGILFNHESPRRGGTFVTKKITNTLAKIKLGIAQPEKLYLGNLNASRDWGYAPEYVEAMWLMLQQETSDDYVIATGESHSVREFASGAAQLIGYDLQWHGEGLDEKGIDAKSGKVLVEIDPHYVRPSEVDHLCGDATKAKKQLGWTPRTGFHDLIRIMVEAEFHGLGEDPVKFMQY
ncbi:MAG: GDP-mannose 4,6-dehydratase [Patescibacteria group bacterium]